MDVFAVDVSPVAIDLARELASHSGVAERCRFEVFDLDQGLPESPQVDLVLCHLFRDPRLDQLMMDRLKPGGTVAIAVLSEVGVGPGPFRARQGELVEAFDAIEVLAAGEVDGLAWLVARRPG
jgi:SAM-dependent methyltransferase